MLGKVLKYDFKRLGKSLTPLYLVTLVMALLNYGFQILGDKNVIFSVTSGLLMFAFILLLMAVIIGTFGITIRYFWVNLFSDEGYLTNTLPVKKSTLINSKIFVSMFYGIVSVIVLFLSIWIGFLNSFNFVDVLVDLYNSKIFELLTGANNWMGLLIFIAMLAITYLSQWLFFTFAIALGQTRTGNRVLYTFVYGIVLYALQQVIGFIMLGALALFDLSFFTASEPSASALLFLYSISILINGGILVAFWYGTIKVFSKKLNLE